MKMASFPNLAVRRAAALVLVAAALPQAAWLANSAAAGPTSETLSLEILEPADHTLTPGIQTFVIAVGGIGTVPGVWVMLGSDGGPDYDVTDQTCDLYGKPTTAPDGRPTRCYNVFVGPRSPSLWSDCQWLGARVVTVRAGAPGVAPLYDGRFLFYLPIAPYWCYFVTPPFG